MRVHIVGSVKDEKHERSFNLQDDLAILADKITEIGDVVAVVIDPITAYMGGNVDAHRTTDVRAVLSLVADWAERLNVAVLAISHPPKASQGKAINAVTGSLAFVAAARLVFIVAEEPETDRHVLLPVKNNLGPKAAGLGYRIVPVQTSENIATSRIEWDDAPVTVTADAAVQGRGAPQQTAFDSAMGFLEDILGQGPVAQGKIEQAATAQNISNATLRRAKKELGVVSEKSDFDGGWTWRLLR
jgi:putative DNA primase/helicase